MRHPLLIFFVVLFATAAALLYRQWPPAPDRSGVPHGFPAVEYPPDNPQTPVKVELGRHLFYERRLSVNQSVACADCHQQSRAFTDQRRFSPGPTGELTKRNAMSLANVAYNARFTWASDTLRSLEQQAAIPLTLEHPLEMGFQINREEALNRLRRDEYYPAAFRQAFPGEENPVTFEKIVKAIASFERILISAGSPYDRYVNGDHGALNDSARRGLALFYSERIACVRCHSGFNFRHALHHRADKNDTSVAFHNTGLYNLDGKGAYPTADQGLIETTGNPRDMGRFKTPTLRNIAVTAPYMHDGSVATLDEAIDHYAQGGREIVSGPAAGDGHDNPYKSPLIRGFEISPEEKRDLIEFLNSLTDPGFLTNPAFAAPIPTGRQARFINP